MCDKPYNPSKCPYCGNTTFTIFDNLFNKRTYTCSRCKQKLEHYYRIESRRFITVPKKIEINQFVPSRKGCSPGSYVMCVPSIS